MWYVGDTETSHDSEGTEAWVWAWAICSVEDPDDIEYGGDIESLVDCLCEHVGDRVYFHNLKFDGEFIMLHLLNTGWAWIPDDAKQAPRCFKTIITEDRNVYKIALSPHGKGYVSIVDSYKVLTLSVAATAKAYGVGECKGDLDYDKYRLPNHAMTEAERDYLRRDVQIVARALKITKEAGDDRITAAGNALQWYRNSIGGRQNFKRVYPELDPEEDAFIRRAYRGGWTYADPRFTEREVGPGMVFDVNSMYPWVMHDCQLPFFAPRRFNGRPRPTDEWPLWVAMVEFRFDVKPDHLPCIQIKGNLRFGNTEYLEHSGASVCMVVSSVDWSLYNDQYDISSVHWHGGYYFRSSDLQFREYVDHWIEQKIEASKTGNDGLRSIAKLKLNSLYGKFATRPGGEMRRPIVMGGSLHTEVVKGDSRHETLYLPVGVFVTAYARDKIVRTAQSVYGRFCYSDTDSIHIVGEEMPDIDVDNYRLGAWKHEDTFERAKYLRAKTYIEQMRGRDRLTVHVAGMPSGMHSQVTFENFAFGATYDGKLYTKHVNNGILLQPGPMMIRR